MVEISQIISRRCSAIRFSNPPQGLNILQPQPSAIPSQRRTVTLMPARLTLSLGRSESSTGGCRRRARAMPLGESWGVKVDVASRNAVENQQVRHSMSLVQIGAKGSRSRPKKGGLRPEAGQECRNATKKADMSREVSKIKTELRSLLQIGDRQACFDLSREAPYCGAVEGGLFKGGAESSQRNPGFPFSSARRRRL